MLFVSDVKNFRESMVEGEDLRSYRRFIKKFKYVKEHKGVIKWTSGSIDVSLRKLNTI